MDTLIQQVFFEHSYVARTVQSVKYKCCFGTKIQVEVESDSNQKYLVMLDGENDEKKQGRRGVGSLKVYFQVIMFCM